MSGVYFFKFLKVIFLLSPFEKLHHSLFYPSILFLTFFSSTVFQMRLWPWEVLHPNLRLGTISEVSCDSPCITKRMQSNVLYANIPFDGLKFYDESVSLNSRIYSTFSIVLFSSKTNAFTRIASLPYAVFVKLKQEV